jgi:hypothetical protein
VAAVQLAGGARAQEEGGEPDVVRYEGDRLTLDVASMPLRTLLLEVGRQSGAQVRIEGLDDRTVSEAFREVRLDEALRRLLAGSNFTLVYAPAASETGGKAATVRLKELRVYGGEGSVVSSAPARPAASSPRPTAAGPATAAQQRPAPSRGGPQPASAGATAPDPSQAQEQGVQAMQPEAAAPDAPGGSQDQGQGEYGANAEMPSGEVEPAVVDIGQAAVDAAGEEEPSAIAAPPPLTNPVSAAVLGDDIPEQGVVFDAAIDPDAAHDVFEPAYYGPVPAYGPVEDGGGGVEIPQE